MKSNMPHGSQLLKNVICSITYYSSRVLDKIKILFSDKDAFVTINPSEVNGRSNMELIDYSIAFKLESNVLYQYARYGVEDEGAFLLECKEELTKEQLETIEHDIDKKLHTFELFGSKSDAIYDCISLPVEGIGIDVDKEKAEAAAKKLEESLEELMKYDSLKDYLNATKGK